jgi:hypothetical protein
MVRDLAERLDVPVPSAIALTPDCDSWLEDRTHPAQTPASGTPEGETGGRQETGGRRQTGGRQARGQGGHGAGSAGARADAPVLVIGSPFLWWMRVAELRALLAPVVAGTGPSVHPDIAAARRFVRGLDAAVAGADKQQGPPGAGRSRLSAARLVGPLARLMLRAAGPHATQMERGVAAAASERAQGVDYGLRVVAQEQVGLAYAGWDRLLTRVALPAWRLGLWPTRLDAGVVSALTELSRRDRLAEGFTSRLGERPACDLLEEPGAVDAAVSLLAARLFLGATPPLPPGSGPGQAPPEWTPVAWSAYPEEVVDRIWRTEAARLFAALDATRPTCAPSFAPDTTGGVAGVAADMSSTADADALDAAGRAGGADAGKAEGGADVGTTASAADMGTTAARRTVADQGTSVDAGHGEQPPGTAEGDQGHDDDHELAGPTLARVLDRFASPGDTEALAARISADVARAEAASAAGAIGATPGAGGLPGAGETHPAPPAPMGLPLQPPRSGRELLADHITAAVCCAAVDTAGAAPGLDWLDGPTLLVEGERRSDLTRLVLALVEEGDARGLREWLAAVGVRPDKPVRLV